MNQELKEKIEGMAKRMRRRALDMAFAAGNNGAHLGPGLSMIEIMAVLYGGIMNFRPEEPLWENRDRFILSKGHGTLGYYTALAEAGFLSDDDINSFEVNGGLFPGQPIMLPEKGIESASGSLGLGLSMGIGIALAIKKKKLSGRVFVLMGDGECNEGTVWESALSCAHFRLDNVIAVVDNNRMQSDGTSSTILDMKDIDKKWDSFGFNVVRVDGHDIGTLYEAFEKATQTQTGMPSVVIAHTIKGKGVSFMENSPAWHHNRLIQTDYEAAIAECG